MITDSNNLTEFVFSEIKDKKIVVSKNEKKLLAVTFDSKNETEGHLEIICEENSNLTLYYFHNQSDFSQNTKVTQKKESTFNFFEIGAGNQKWVHNLNVVLSDEHANASLSGLFLGTENQKQEYHITVDHLKPHSTSHIFYKGIINDKAKGVFNGKVIIRPQASKTETRQVTKNLLLSKDGEIDPKPELEIYNDDVKASHGATVGSLDETELFYCLSRGLDLTKAKKILTEAFAHEMTNSISHPLLQKRANEMIDQVLK